MKISAAIEESVELSKWPLMTYKKLPLAESLSVDNDNSEVVRIAQAINEQLKEHVVNLEASETDNFYARKSNFIRFPVVAFGTTGGIPFIGLSSKAAGNNQILKWLYVVGTLSSNGFSTMWALNNALNYLGLDSIELPGHSAGCNRKASYIAKHFFVNSLSLLDSVPITYAAYKYNDGGIYPIPAFFSEYGFRMSGYYRFIDDISDIRNKNSDKHVYLKKIRNIFPAILALDQEIRDECIKKLHADKIEVTEYVGQLFDIVDTRDQERIETNNRIRNFILFMASPIYVSNALKHAVLAYNGMRFTTGSGEFAAFSSFTSTIYHQQL